MSEEMIDIGMGGVNVTGPEATAPRGAAQAAVNLLPAAGGGLMAAGRPGVVLDLGGEDRRLVAIHETTDYRHYIISAGEGENLGLLWMEAGAEAEGILGPDGGLRRVVRVQAVGNTLVMLYEDGNARRRVCYYLFVAATANQGAGYKRLGESIPEIELRFGLRGDIRRGDNNGAFYGTSDDYEKFKNGDRDSGIEMFSCGGLPIKREMLYSDFEMENPLDWENFQSTDDYTQTWGWRLTQTVIGKVNKWKRTQGDGRGRFVDPFLVRWALRLYDGSVTRQSAPVLMLPTTGAGPVVQNVAGADTDQYYTEKDGGIVKAWFSIWGVTAQLMWGSPDFNILHSLRTDWRDIVKGVEVYVSAPLTRYDQEGKVTSFTRPGDLEDTGKYGDYSVMDTSVYQATPTLRGYGRRTLPNFYHDQEGEFPWGKGDGWTGVLSKADRWLGIVNLPRKSDEAWLKTLRETAEFYHVASVDMIDLPVEGGGMVEVPIEEGALTALTARRRLGDDYKSHDVVGAEDMYAFNGRLMLGNVTRRVFAGFPAGGMVGYTEGKGRIRVRFRRQTNTGDVTTEYRRLEKEGWVYGSEFAAGSADETPVKYLYHPDSRVDRADIEWEGTKRWRRTVKMEPHTFLHGAVWCEMPETGANAGETSGGMDFPEEGDMERIERDGSAVYASEVGNPFVYPLGGVYTVGTGNVIAIRAAVRALSQGQFGEFPLYAFTDEGIWALATAGNGSFAAVQPISRDVCISGDSICQTDSAVVFETDRGIMMISGVDTTLLSRALRDGNPVRRLGDLGLTGLDRLAELGGDDIGGMLDPQLPQGGRIVYDYGTGRLWVYEEGNGALVLDMATGGWGCVEHTKLGAPVEAYPRAWVNVGEGKVADLGDLRHEGDDGVGVVWVSRSVSVASGEGLGTVRRMVVRGDFERGSVGMVVWGTRDGRHWHVVGSSRRGDLRGVSGTGYVAFRVGVAGILGGWDHLLRVSGEVKGRGKR